MASPRVSVISPCYNQAHLVLDCARSVQRQTVGDWEQIFVDDGSTDGTPDVIDALGDSSIRVLRLKHRGLPALAESYNAGLAVASGEIVAVLEGDDAWPPDKLASQLPAFADPDVFLSWGRATAIGSDGAPIKKLSTQRTDRAWIDFDAADIFARLVRTNVLAPTATVMIRRRTLEAIGGFQQSAASLYVDLATWLTVMARTRGTVRFVNRDLAWYRIHDQQTTHQFGRQMSEQHAGIVEHVVSALDEETLKRLGWAGLERDLETSRLVAAGRGALADRDYRTARRTFARALAAARRWTDRGKASIGALSAALHMDLLSPMLSWRAARMVALPEHVSDAD